MKNIFVTGTVLAVGIAGLLFAANVTTDYDHVARFRPLQDVLVAEGQGQRFPLGRSNR